MHDMSTKYKRNVYVVGGANDYVNWMQAKIVPKMEDADLVCFTGGSDVSPSFYGKKAHPTTCPNPGRDAVEYAEFQKAKALGKKMIGICRGSQFICVMAGGTLVQNMSHPSRHMIHDVPTDREYIVASSHHQMQDPWGVPGAYIIAMANESTILEGEGGEIISMEGQPEIVQYTNGFNALAIQSHPEWQYPERELGDEKTIRYLRGLLDILMEIK